MIYLFCIFLLLSCSSDSKQRMNNTTDKPFHYKNDTVEIIVWKDTVSINGIKWIDMLRFQPIAIEAIDKQDSILHNKVKNYINVILKRGYPEKITETTECTNGINPSLELKRALKEGDCRAYSSLFGTMGDFEYSDLVDLIPFSLYMAEKFNCSEAYYNIFMYYQRGKKVNGKVVWFALDDASKKNEQLALYCLVKSFQAGYFPSVGVLHEYYKGVQYFPQNDTVCNMLDSISASNSEYWKYIKRERKK